MALFDEKPITSQDVSHVSQKQVLPFIVGRQIDRILAKSGDIYSSKQASLAPTIASLKNMRAQLLFLSRFLEPYIRRDILKAPDYKEKTRLPAPRTTSEVDEQVEALSDVFAEIVNNLGYVKMLPPVSRGLKSASD